MVSEPQPRPDDDIRWIDPVQAEIAAVTDGFAWAAAQLEAVMVTPSPVNDRPRAVRTHDQFQEAEGDEEYRLDAAEDREAYHRWLTTRRAPLAVGSPNTPARLKAATRPTRRARPLVSFVMPIWNPPIYALEHAVASVLAQSDPAFELIICDDGSSDPNLAATLTRLAKCDRRISVTALERNSGISAATNGAIARATGTFVGFIDQDDLVAPQSVAALRSVLDVTPDADVVYSDEDKIDATGIRYDPLFKPEWSPDLLLSFAYICHLTLIRRTLVDQLSGLRSAFDGSQDYDLVLRATEAARSIVHVPDVLYHWRALATSTASGAAAKPWAFEAGRRAVADAIARRDEPGTVVADDRFPGRYHVEREISGNPRVSVIIPFRDEPSLLALCTSSIRKHAGHDNVEYVLVDNGSELPETKALLFRLADQPDVRILDAPGPFNWAAINNAAARASTGEYLVFLNNDIEARKPGWLRALLGNAQRRDVGAVGARLLYDDGSIQHAGVVIGLGGIAGHVLRGLPGERPGYNSMAIVTRESSVLTGACLMVRRDVFFSVDGFDEELAVAFNDVDFCLKLRERGLRLIYTPLAELIHYESKSRGHTDDTFESGRILGRWGDVLRAGDPYLNSHLSHWRYWCPLSTPQEDYRWQTYLERSTSTLAPSSTE
ncbi:MAG TPA: glycosyltransferase [Acidimicrobiales bacterium]|jgi:GT2 family glycosyltransferase|nr:glycosyltransferase [Acidimicrobiales bacterium]